MIKYDHDYYVEMDKYEVNVDILLIIPLCMIIFICCLAAMFTGWI